MRRKRKAEDELLIVLGAIIIFIVIIAGSCVTHVYQEERSGSFTSQRECADLCMVIFNQDKDMDNFLNCADRCDSMYRYKSPKFKKSGDKERVNEQKR